MDKKIQVIREDVQQAKSEAKKYIQFPVAEVSYLLQQIEIKDKALGFYADLKNWEQYYGSLDIDSAILNDYGIIARAALKGEDTE
ncbi:hypothetical protein MMB75_25360 [Paenibacillus sp. P2(2022)]|uniref:hypothetical protein n=1 Tax=Paenibacillus sp. P2(2022) TaxID=2917813 RepID=UPI0024066CCF|nr:hypothetical protein [Paenibacillus sp. P2(2022)]MDG0056957.1 hypothetical protein [Paenibacillus sp. P2(2022)]